MSDPFGPIEEDWTEASVLKMLSDPEHLQAVMDREHDRLNRLAEHHGIELPGEITVKYNDGSEETWKLA